MDGVCDSGYGQNSLKQKKSQARFVLPLQKGKGTYLSRSGKHGFTGVESGSRSLLDLLDLASTLSDPLSIQFSTNTYPTVPPKSQAMINPTKKTQVSERLTYTVPILELGMMNLIVTALEPGTEATSKGSSLIRRTISPKACSNVH